VRQSLSFFGEKSTKAGLTFVQQSRTKSRAPSFPEAIAQPL
jgi:hypothetical protein